MRIKTWIVTALMRFYPPAWRREYGPELLDMLLARPLGAAVISDVAWSGLRRRVREAEPSTLLGLAVMLVILTGFVWNIAAPFPSGRGFTAMLRESSMTFPTVKVTPLASDFYVLLLVGCGCWTYLRHGDTLSRSAIAAMRFTIIAGIPVMLAGALMLFGILDVIVLAPGDAPTTFREHGFAYTHDSAQLPSLTSLSLLVVPFLKLGESWIWGSVGGWLGRRLLQMRRTPATSS